MQDQQFWTIVANARQAAGNNVETRVATLEKELDKLTTDDIQQFKQVYDAMIQRAYRWDLWGAAYLINGGCSDDGFRYFCDWLISEGHDTFERALHSPDSLADLPQLEDVELELFAYVAPNVFKKKSGREISYSINSDSNDVAGDEWSEEELPSLFPRLAEIYL